MSPASPLVSIAMPFYNCAETLPAALQSIVRQTYRNWELLLCDDGSSDESLVHARAFAGSRVVVWSDGRRRGLAARLNECIDRARGAYLARMDADDITYPERLEKQVRFLEAHAEIDLVGSQMLIFGDGGLPLGKRVLPEDHAGIVAHPAIAFGMGHPTWLGRAAWFRRYRYSPAALRFEDVELLYRSYRESCFANLPEVLHGYREPNGGLRKRLRTRIERVKFLWRSGNPGALPAALVEPAKAACDAVIAGAGLRYVMLRARETALTGEEIARWRDLFQQASARETLCPR